MFFRSKSSRRTQAVPDKTGIVRQSLVILVLCAVMFTILLVVCESSLRLLGRGKARNLFTAATAGNEPVYHVNPLFYAQFFPPENEKDVVALPYWGFTIPRNKGANTYRIVVLGGSVALGHVPDEAFNFSRILECMLSTAFPDLDFEVYNLACFALNSHVMRRAARECVALSPDLFVVYMGNNEYIGPFGPSRPSSNPPATSAWIQGQIFLQQFRLSQVLREFGVNEAYRMPESPIDFFFESVKLRHDSPGRMAMYDNFAANLAAICASARRSDAQVVFCTLGNNLKDWPPYASENRPDLTGKNVQDWQALYEQGIAAQKKADEWRSAFAGTTDAVIEDQNSETPGPLFEEVAEAYGQALHFYMAAAELDDSHAQMQFRMGQCYWRIGAYEDARGAFTKARDYDCFPIRGDSFINTRIRDMVARDASGRTLLADVEQAFIARSPNGVQGFGIFYDPMHVLFEGNHIIAAAIYDAVKETVARRAGVSTPENPPALEMCRQLLGMSPYLEVRHGRVAAAHLARYLGARYNPEEINLPTLQQNLAQMEEGLTRNALAGALGALEKAQELREDDFLVRRVMVDLLYNQGKTEEARLQAQRALERFPNRPDAQMLYDRMMKSPGKESNR